MVDGIERAHNLSKRRWFTRRRGRASVHPSLGETQAFVLKAGLDCPSLAVSECGRETLAAPSHVAVTPPDYPGYKCG